MNESPKIIGAPASEKKVLTQKEVENFILLAGQSGERWFKLSFVDEEMNDDPTACALMQSIGDVIHEGIMGASFAERMAQAEEDVKGVDLNAAH